MTVKGGTVSPRDVVAAVVPDPATLGEHMRGRAVVGTWVRGLRDGRPREVYLYQMCDAQETMARHGLQPVGVADGLQSRGGDGAAGRGRLVRRGVLAPEAFDPDPYLAILDRDGIHHAMVEIEPGHATA